ncbi:probable chitinase 10 [Teleopsis dalmanni]|uniref:probable chitinase 10 n=1 Tax=Teleopsis dalmanni TaxID=139649 RepID=UPI0018CCD8D1|nr:probable chitinase 10 [Teleopsis dalmanni]
MIRILIFLVFVVTQILLSFCEVATNEPIRHPQCPSYYNPQNPTFLPYPYDCQKYYTCLNGLAFTMICPENLHWSSSTNTCDLPSKAGCMLINPSLQSPQIITSMSGAVSTYAPNPNDCNQFYFCQAMQCPANLHWNARLQRCDLPQFAACQAQQYYIPNTISLPTNSATLPVTNQSPTILIPSYPATNFSNDLNQLCSASKHAYVKHPTDCHQFIQCNGIAFVHTCPDNLFWNSELMTCDHLCI